MKGLDSVPDLIEDIKAGKAVILVDDEDRENEGDLIIAADYITPQMVNFMATEARGLICLSLTSEQIERLNIPLMTKDETNRSPNRTAFTVSIEAAKGVSTGISAADRALTIKVASNPSAQPQDIIVPGHVFPIRAQDGGVLKRAGHTEASVDLVRMAGLNPAAVICEIMNPDGTMARLGQLIEFAQKHLIKIGTIESLIKFRIQNESFLVERAQAMLPCRYGKDFRIHIFENMLDGREHVAIVKGEIDPERPILVRVHSENIMGDVFGSLRTRSGDFLDMSMRRIEEEGAGVVVYLRLEDMGQRLRQRVMSYHQMDRGEKATEESRKVFRSDDRDYGIGAQILRSLGARKLRLITNSHSKRVGLKGYGLEIVEEIPMPIEAEPLIEVEL
ncbi:MAG: 3,4-dihydroxy-2-butanone-4-phosphate synthase [Bdellovibrionales bacterium]